MKKHLIFWLSMLLLFTLIGCTEKTTTELTETTTSWHYTYTPADQTYGEQVAVYANTYNIALFLTENPSTSIGINFELPEDGQGYVEYRILGTTGPITVVYATKKVNMVGRKTVYHHEAILSNLTPGTTYEYRISNDGGSIKSDAHQFVTPQANPTEFSFMVLADPQETSELGYMAFAHAILNVMDEVTQKPDFMMFVGDVVNDSDVRSQWNALFKYSSMFIYDTPIVATTGNHDVSGISGARMSDLEFDGYFNLPNNGPVYNAFDELEDDSRPANFDDGKTYSITYGNTHFVAINTETLCDGTTACAANDTTNVDQLKQWLNDDLSANESKWTIVFMHRGPYTLSYNTYMVRQELAPIFDAHQVDLVLSGHDHQYSRSVYKETNMVPFNRGDTYARGSLLLDPTDVLDSHFNNYSSSLGVTYVVGNTASTKFYGGDKASGIPVQYRFIDENPVIPQVIVSDTSIQVYVYGLLKSNAIQIEVDEVYLLESFTITK